MLNTEAAPTSNPLVATYSRLKKEEADKIKSEFVEGLTVGRLVFSEDRNSYRIGEAYFRRRRTFRSNAENVRGLEVPSDEPRRSGFTRYGSGDATEPAVILPGETVQLFRAGDPSTFAVYAIVGGSDGGDQQ